jgi:hypothetical protein
MPSARLARGTKLLAIFILTYITVSSLDLVACIQALLPLIWFRPTQHNSRRRPREETTGYSMNTGASRAYLVGEARRHSCKSLAADAPT